MPANVAVSNNKWTEAEGPVANKRVDRCNQTISNLVKGPISKDKDYPIVEHAASTGTNENKVRIAVALSGGGWRAMTSGVAFLDGLSTPLDEGIYTFNGHRTLIDADNKIKLIDTVSHLFGLSGGSWCLYTTLAGAERNPFHTSVDENRAQMSKSIGTQKDAVSLEDKSKHPWLHGPDNYFDAQKHTYKGLENMLDAQHIRDALQRIRVPAFLADKLAIQAVPMAALSGRLGDTMVERWSNFIANNILSFKDDGDDLNGKEARDIKLSELRKIVNDGDFPFVVCSAIANRNDEGRAGKTVCAGAFCCTSAAEDQGKNVNTPTTVYDKTPLDARRANRRYDWVEISPYFIRNPFQPTQHFTSDVDDSTANFDRKRKAENGKAFRVHHAMGVCGSAFAFDYNSAPVASQIFGASLSTRPILGSETISQISYGKKDTSSLCRDAGIDFNVPFPPALVDSSARDPFDIIIVMDAGGGSTGASELAQAVAEGHLDLDSAATEKANVALGLDAGTKNGGIAFEKNQRVRVYRTTNNGPTIIYFLGLTERSTMVVAVKPEEIQADVRRIRESVKKDLLPVLLHEIARATASGVVESTFSYQKMAMASISTDSESQGLSVSDATSVASPNTDQDNTSADGSISCDHSAIRLRKNDTNTFNDASSQIICRALSTGNFSLKSALDAFEIVEASVLIVCKEKALKPDFGNIDVGLETEAQCCVIKQKLQQYALHRLTKVPTNIEPIQKSVENTVGSAISKTLLSSLVQLGILSPGSYDLTSLWADYYAATGIAQSLSSTQGKAIAGNPLPMIPGPISPFLFAKSSCPLLLGSIVRLTASDEALAEVGEAIIAPSFIEQIVTTENQEQADNICDSLVDFYSELLGSMTSTFDNKNPIWEQRVIASFVKTLGLVLNLEGGDVHVRRIAKAVVGNSSEESLILLSVLSGPSSTSSGNSSVKELTANIQNTVHKCLSNLSLTTDPVVGILSKLSNGVSSTVSSLRIVSDASKGSPQRRAVAKVLAQFAE